MKTFRQYREQFVKERPIAIGLVIILCVCLFPIVAWIGLSAIMDNPGTMIEAQGIGVLLNPGFEDGFGQVDDTGELTVANDWTPWWHPGSARPEYKEATNDIDPRRIYGGDSASQWFNTYNTHTAGIYQRVYDVPPGNTAAFECWVQAFSSNSNDFSKSAGKYRMRLGLDPYGGIDPESPDIIWSNDGHAVEPYDEYQLVAVSTSVRSDRVTVFIWGQAEWPLRHNNGYVDECSLIFGGAQPTPTVVPGGGFSEEQIRDFARQEARLELVDMFEEVLELLK